MLTQRKEKRTVEDFNQFCTFVLAYAGYIPYPAEEQWTYLTTPHEDDSTSKIKKGQRESVRKRKSDGTHPASQTGKKTKCDSQNTKTSRGAQKPPKSPASKPLPEKDGDRTAQPNSELATTSSVDPARSPEHCHSATQTRNLPGSLPSRSSGHYDATTGSDMEEVKDKPFDLTLKGSDRETISEVTGVLAREDGGEERKEEREDGGEERKEEEMGMRGGTEERKEERGMEGGTEERKEERGMEGGTAMVTTLQMVMNNRLRCQLPEDQETGYHTDLDGTPDRCSAGLSPSSSPAWALEDAAEENSKLEEDDSWDLITCFCFKPFAGRPMIECNQCSTWVHLSCAKVRHTHIPDVFICQPCRDSREPIRRSNRARVPTRKRLSDQ